MAYEAGTAFLQVTASFRGIQSALRGIARDLGANFEDAVASALPEGMRQAAREAGPAGRRAADAYAGEFNSQLKRRIEQAQKALGQEVRVNIVADRAPFDQAVNTVRRRLRLLLREIDRGVDPRVAMGALDRLRTEIHRLADDAQDDWDRINLNAAGEQLQAMTDLVEGARRRGFDAGENFGGAFGRAARKSIDDTLSKLPNVSVEFDPSPFNRTVQSVRDQLDDLRRQRIGIDIDAREFMRRVRAITEVLDGLAEHAGSIEMGFNPREAAKEMRRFFDQVEKQVGDGGDRAGEAYTGRFREALREGLANVQRELPEVGVDVDTGRLQELRRQLAALSGMRIGVDIDEARFLAAMRQIREQLADINGRTVSAEARVNSGAALAELTTLLALMDRVDGRDMRADAHINTDQGMRSLRELGNEFGLTLGRLGFLVSTISALGTAVVPIAAAAAAGIGAIGTAALAAASGVGVLILGFSGIGDAVKALDKFSKDADKSAASLATAQAGVASAADAVASAERSLINTRQQAARAAERAAQSIVDAERQVARAQRDARQAVLDLIAAREEERRQQEDMALRIKGGALAVRQAQLDIAEARAELDKVLANPKATEAEREQARINYEERVLQLKELTVRQKRMTADQATAVKKGINGSDRVLAAQQRVNDATQRVADANRRVAEAQQAQRDQQRQSAFQIAAAQQSVISAQRSLQQATVRAGVAGGEAMRNLRQAMDALSPAGQRFARFLFSLKDEFKGLRDAAQEGMLPGFQRAIEMMLPKLGGLERFIFKVGRGLGSLAIEAVKALDDPVWRRFFGYIDKTAVPALKGMFQFAENIARGLAGLFLALTPFNEPIGTGLLEMSEGFARWASTLDTNTGFQKFLAYVREAGPKVVDVIKSLWTFVGRFVEAAAPIGLFVLDAFTGLVDLLNRIPIDDLRTLISLIAGTAAAFVAVAAVTAIITTGWAGLIVAAIALVVGAFVFLYKHVAGVRAAVDATVRFIVAAFQFMATNVWGPQAQLIVATFQAIGSAVATLWTDWIQPFLKTIGFAVGVMGATWVSIWQSAIKPTLDAIGWVLSRVIGPIVVFFYRNVIKPVLENVGVAFKILSAIAKVVFGILQIGFKIVAAVVSAFWFSTVKPIVDKVRSGLQVLGTLLDIYVIPPFKKALKIWTDIWAKIRDAAKVPIRFVIEKVLNEGILKGYNTIAKAFDVKPDDVKIDISGWARGGPVFGPGTSTSDSIIGRLSDDEHVWTAKEVDAAGGHRNVIALRRAALRGELPAFANGGPVGGGASGDGWGWLGKLVAKAKETATDVFQGIKDFLSDPPGTLRKLADRLLNIVPGKDTLWGKGMLGIPKKVLGYLVDKVTGLFHDNRGGQGTPSSGGVGSAVMMQILRREFPGLALFSGFRPGSRTSSGSLSYHAMQAANGLAGRAVDVPPRQDVFDFIHKNYFRVTRELIWGGDPGRNIWNGRHHRYSDALLWQHGPFRGRSGPSPHLHWAYDGGGMLPPGWSMAWNGTGVPEAVLTARQWRDIGAIAKQVATGGNNYTFQFRDTTLTPGKLQAMQRAEDAYHRAGRAR